MKSLIAALILLSFSSFASEILKVSDGSVALCESKVDVYRYRAGLVYRPLGFKVIDGNAEVTVEFLKCVQEGDTFKFVTDKNISSRTIVVETASREQRTIRIEREKFALVAYRSNDIRLLSRTELADNGNHTYTATLPLVLSDLQVNRDGKRFFEMSLSHKIKLVDDETNRVIDARTDFLGTYRMVIK